MCGTVSLRNQTGKGVKNTEENKTLQAESVLKSWRTMGGENRRDTGKARVKPGWVVRGKPRPLREWPKTFHAICTTRSVSSGYSAQRYDYLTTSAMALDW